VIFPSEQDLNDAPLWARAKALVDKDVMAEARRIYKAETGKACSNAGMEQCLRVAIFNLLKQQESRQ